MNPIWRMPCSERITVSSSSGMARTPPVVGSAFPFEDRVECFFLEFLCLWRGSGERRRRTIMTVKTLHLILIYGGNKSLQSIKKKKLLFINL